MIYYRVLRSNSDKKDILKVPNDDTTLAKTTLFDYLKYYYPIDEANAIANSLSTYCVTGNNTKSYKTIFNANNATPIGIIIQCKHD